MGPGSEKLAKIVIVSLVANNPMLRFGIGLGAPVPNICANARSFRTLSDTFAAELPTNFGITEDRWLRSQRASTLLATVYVPP